MADTTTSTVTPATLAEAVRKKAKDISVEATTGEPTPLAEQTSKDTISTLQDLVKHPEFTAVAPPSAREEVQSAVDKAEQLYNSRSDRNDWLEVAQTLGRAAAQFGAAQTAKANGDRYTGSSLNMGSPIDYNARSDRAARDYQHQTGNIYKGADLARQEALDADRVRRENFQMQAEPIKEQLRLASHNESQDKTLAQNAANQRATDERQDKSLNLRERLEAQKAELGDLSKQEANLQTKLKAGLSASNNSQLMNDLGKKSKDKVQEQYGKLLGDAGIDLDEVQVEKPGTLNSLTGGLIGGNTVDTEATKKNFDAEVGKIQNMLAAIRSRKKELLGQSAQSQIQSSSGPASSNTNQAPTPQSPPATDKVMVRNKAGQLGEIPRSQLADALSKGYTEVK